MRFSIEKVKKNGVYGSRNNFFIIFLIYRTFSNIIAGITVSAIDFKDVNIEMEKNFTVLFADFD